MLGYAVLGVILINEAVLVLAGIPRGKSAGRVAQPAAAATPPRCATEGSAIVGRGTGAGRCGAARGEATTCPPTAA
jgi:hypothetical protein